MIDWEDLDGMCKHGVFQTVLHFQFVLKPSPLLLYYYLLIFISLSIHLGTVFKTSSWTLWVVPGSGEASHWLQVLGVHTWFLPKNFLEASKLPRHLLRTSTFSLNTFHLSQRWVVSSVFLSSSIFLQRQSKYLPFFWVEQNWVYDNRETLQFYIDALKPSYFDNLFTYTDFCSLAPPVIQCPRDQ